MELRHVIDVMELSIIYENVFVQALQLLLLNVKLFHIFVTRSTMAIRTIKLLQCHGASENLLRSQMIIWC